MQFTEIELRSILQSSAGQSRGQEIVDTVKRGTAVTIVMDDGSRLRLSGHSSTVTVLRQIFGWKPQE